MKLGEALELRAEMQNNTVLMAKRMEHNAKAPEGVKPSEDPYELMDEVDTTSESLCQLIQRINKTNARTEVESGLTLSDLLTDREILRTRYGFYKTLAESSTISYRSYLRSPDAVSLQGVMDVSEMRKKADEIAREYRTLDLRIQSANWVVDLLE